MHRRTCFDASRAFLAEPEAGLDRIEPAFADFAATARGEMVRHGPAAQFLDRSDHLQHRVGRSRYAEESRTSAARIILHLHPLNPEGVTLQYFVRTNQHEEECRRAL